MTLPTLREVPVKTHENGARSRLMRFCTPTIADALFLILLIRVLQLGATGLFNDPGTGWHLRTGDLILSTGSLPTADAFSYTRRDQPWVATQWLGSVVMSLAFDLGGYSLIALGTAALLASLFRWIYRTQVSANGWPAVAVVVTLVAAGAASGHFLARPLVATSIGVPLCFWWATQYARKAIGAKRLWLLVPLGAIWSNIHPGVLGGIATIFICGLTELACAVLSRRQPRGAQSAERLRRALTIIAVGTAMAAATLLNPYGLEWHRQIFHLMSLASLAQYVDEWLPPVRSAPDTLAAALLVLACAVTMVLRRGRTRIAETLVILFWIWQGFSSVRHLPLMSMIVALQLGRILSDVRIEPGRLAGVGKGIPIFSSAMREAESRTPGGLTGLACLATLVVVQTGGLTVPTIGLGVARLPERRYSSAAVDYLRSHRPAGPLFNVLDYGGMLIHDLPEVPVFIDDRFELYGEDMIKEYRAAVLKPADSADVLLDRWETQTVLIRTSLPMAAWLSDNPAWTESYRDQVVAIYTRVPSLSMAED